MLVIKQAEAGMNEPAGHSPSVPGLLLKERIVYMYRSDAVALERDGNVSLAPMVSDSDGIYPSWRIGMACKQASDRACILGGRARWLRLRNKEYSSTTACNIGLRY